MNNVKPRDSYFTRLRKNMKIYYGTYIMAIPVVVYFIVFAYLPMYGIIIAFQNYVSLKGILGSTFVGLKHFRDFFSSYYFIRLLINTLLISVYGLLFAFPAAIILALLLNEVRNRPFKRVVQTITYMPYFISLVVVATLILDFTLPEGFINDVRAFFGAARVNLMGSSSYFRTIYVGSNIWQYVGFDSIIFLAAIAGVDMQIYEAAIIDGAGRLRQTWHVTLPGILPTIVIILILRIGSIMNVGFEKIILIYNPTIYNVADVISSFVYRKGIMEANYAYSTAVGFFNSVCNFTVLVAANALSKRITKSSLW